MKVLRKEMVYPQPPEVVWVALTDPAALAEWLMPNDFKPEIGHRFRFEVDPAPLVDTHETRCEVLEIDPPRRMVWSWVIVRHNTQKRAYPPMRVEWTLTPEGPGTRLLLEQRGLEGQSWLYMKMMSGGWGTMLKRWVPRILARVGPDGRFTPGAIPLAKRCYKTKEIGDDLVR